MTTLGQYLRLARQLSWRETCRRGGALALRRARYSLQKWRDRRSSTYLTGSWRSSLHFRLLLPDVVIGPESAAMLHRNARQAMAHEFDLLGSGPVKVQHGMRYAGIEDVSFPPQASIVADAEGRWLEPRVTPANYPESQRIWRLIGQSSYARPGYIPLDWQIDLRSGYRWSETSYHSDIRIGPARGADIKIPWELARMQHLPQLALAARLGEAGAAEELRAQILDFIASNPPRYGVNWKTPMDVAIRAVNWLVALGLMQGQGCDYDADFRAVVGRSIAEHGRHVLQHLEWSEEPRSNHYFANIVGLLFIAAHLPDLPEARDWLGFATREFLVELELQFHADGGCYEASTGYHRLSGEMALLGAALLLGLGAEAAAGYRRLKVRPPQNTAALPLSTLPDGPETVLPPSLWHRLERLAEFTADIIKPDGRPLLIGDQDSGRLIKLDPETAQPHNHNGLLRMAGALFGRADLLPQDGGTGLEGAAVRALAKQHRLPTSAAPYPSRRRRIGSVEAPEKPMAATRTIRLPLPAMPAVTTACYPDFGLYILRSDRFFAAVRCFDPTTPGIWGHSHDDNLALELWIDGTDYSTDPGTYVYTPLPEHRDLYRSAAAHFAPRPSGAVATQIGGPFQLRQLATGCCLQFGAQGLVTTLHGADWSVERRILIEPDHICVADTVTPQPLTLFTANGIPVVTDGYGIKTSRPAYLL